MTSSRSAHLLTRTTAFATFLVLVSGSVPAFADGTEADTPEPSVAMAESSPAEEPAKSEPAVPAESARAAVPATSPSVSAGATPTPTSAAAVAAAVPEPGDPCYPGACIDNGTILLGVNPAGMLNIFNAEGSASGGRGDVGLHFLPTGNDGTVAGVPYEGWGIADPTTGTWGGANLGGFGPGGANLTVESFQSTSSTATSVVTVGEIGDPTFRVTHQFTPSQKTPNLYVVTVTIQNLTDHTIDQVLYRRVMDWDIEPTPFSELVTIASGDALAILRTSDNGFASINPLDDPGGVSGDLADSGPTDHGAMFDFAFGPLAPGALLRFFIFFGAASTEDEANSALAAVGAEAYSLGQTANGGSTGEPNTFIFAFSGIQGTPIFPATGLPAASTVSTARKHSEASPDMAQLPDTGAPVGRSVAPIGLSLLLLGMGLTVAGRRREGHVSS